MIYAAAVRRITDHHLWTLPPPMRHSDIINQIRAGYEVDRYHRHEFERGFISTDGEFMTREQAWQEAVNRGQLLPKNSLKPGQLFCEDLW